MTNSTSYQWWTRYINRRSERYVRMHKSTANTATMVKSSTMNVASSLPLTLIKSGASSSGIIANASAMRGSSVALS